MVAADSCMLADYPLIGSAHVRNRQFMQTEVLGCHHQLSSSSGNSIRKMSDALLTA
jgi:hypothetical protein